MQAIPPALAVSAALLVSACAATGPHDFSPLVAGQYRNARLVVETQSSGFEPPAWTSGQDDASLPVVSVHTRLLAVEPALAERILGERASGLVSLVAGQAEVRAAMEMLRDEGNLTEGEELQNVTLTLRDGEEGSVTITRQEAYIASFELVVSEENAIADPRIDVINDGLLLVVRSSIDEESGAVGLELVLTLTELERPLAERTVHLVGPAAPVTIQTPECLVRTLSTGSTLAADQVLVVGGSSLPVGDGRVLVALVTVER